MTNFERLTNLKTPEEMTYVHCRLQQWAIYAEGRLLSDSPIDFLTWLNKETNKEDNVIFDMNPVKCPKCGNNPSIVKYPDNSIHYHCDKCNYNKYNSLDYIETKLEALIEWNK